MSVTLSVSSGNYITTFEASMDEYSVIIQSMVSIHFTCLSHFLKRDTGNLKEGVSGQCSDYN